jgi:ABC-type nitrate/sulfonate/bicarbonate transport system substrate-binding protein
MAKIARLVILVPCIWPIFGFGQVLGQTHIEIGIISPTFGHAPFYVAREKGFYKAEGSVGEVIVMNRDDLILQSLVSDSIQFGNISPSAFFPAWEQGLTDLKLIAGSFNAPAQVF